jgi:hypothetical protein
MPAPSLDPAGSLTLSSSVRRAAVADENRASDLLLEHQAHLALQPDHHVEVRDVDDVVAVQLLLLVDRRRRGDAAGQPEELLLLQRPLDVAAGARLLVGDVGHERLDSRERALADLAEDLGRPTRCGACPTPACR